MRSRNPFWQEWWVLVAWIGGATLLGAAFSTAYNGFVAGLILYLVWHLRNLRKLDRWLRGKSSGLSYNAPGIWGEIYYWLYRLRRRDRRRKKRLSSVLDRYRASFEALPDAVVILGEGELIEWWNPPAARWLGLHKKQDIGQPITNLLRQPEFLRFIAEGELETELTIRSSIDERRMLSLRLVPYGKDETLMIARDITRLQQLEQMRSDFVANVSHELRTPLTVISGYLETLEADDSLDEPVHKAIGIMGQQSRRLQSIVSDLLLLSRLETDTGTRHEEDVDMKALLSMICDDARALSSGQHEIVLALNSNAGLHGSRDELRSAFSNLVYNAVHYTDAGGHIRVSWDEDDLGLFFRVSDDGPGIPENHIPRLTERFYRVDAGRSRERGGTGLGLAIVKHVMLKHRGELEIYSKPGEGSTFTCRFPEPARSGSLS